MRNEFIKFSIDTGIANFPEYCNINNQTIEEEFDLIKTPDNKMILDVSATNISGYKASFANLDVNQLNIIEGSTQTNLRNYIQNVITDSDYLKTIYSQTKLVETVAMSAKNNGISSPAVAMSGVYGAGSSAEYDMSDFFSSKPKGILKDVSTDNLYNSVLFRIIDGLRIPLSVGTIVTGNKLRLMVYHDHIMLVNNVKKVERVFVAVVNANDGSGVIQYGPAETVIISSN